MSEQFFRARSWNNFIALQTWSVCPGAQVYSLWESAAAERLSCSSDLKKKIGRASRNVKPAA
jgi:hypothetical protein